MDGPRSKVGLTRFGVWWLRGLYVLMALAVLTCPLGISPDIVVGGFDDTWDCLILAGCVAAVSLGVGFWQLRGPAWMRIPGVLVSFGALSLVSVAMLASNLWPLIEPAIDFPPERTQTFAARLPIMRAYATSNGGGLQTAFTGLRGRIAISRQDFDLMAAHQAPDAHGMISSNGYFCANVTVQRSGKALRIPGVVHRGLPPGSVAVCRSDYLAGS